VDQEEEFYCQLGKSIQAWLWVESEVYGLYVALMQGANKHLVSATFNHIQSFDAKLGLLNSCFALIFDSDSAEWKNWKQLFNRAEKLNKKRNKIVHEPAGLTVEGGRSSMTIGPSHLNSLALVKKQTTHKGPVVTASYQPSAVRLLEDHKLDRSTLQVLERTFKAFSHELSTFRESVDPALAAALRHASASPK
jgi:hypothetical protein